ncbi:hypothetical protein H7849_18465 [Alloacidobacterium dinghuense]|uniref:Uncharacterized protein n=1 Tax=Alloacidobacterium dinghuense TaxID=2763107 RepID=A0A7G8BEV1_9BACT|nr:hypothetical protein [Alloacidobacterium dinghuense]QNI31071.1 hypothetical protein H7849_18465 [Alloacidobacterium dinghuense]
MWMKLRYGRLVCGLFVGASAMAHGQQKVLVIDGHSGQIPVIAAGGGSCVGIEPLASLMNGSLSFSGNQITLSLHGGSASQPGSQGFTQGFLSAAIEAMSEIREWRSALQTAVQYGFPTNSDWVNHYSGPAAASVRQASVAATSESDRHAAQLIGNELNFMQQLSDKMISARKNLSYIAPNALETDPLDKKILNCAHSLAGMEASGQFHDDGSCH